MNFKTPKQEAEYNGMAIWPILKEVLRVAEDYNSTLCSNPLVITSILRTFEEDLQLKGSGIHVLGRAADIRASCWTDPIITKVANYINALYVYDSARPSLKVALFTEHGNGSHLHVQCHARTKLRNS